LFHQQLQGPIGFPKPGSIMVLANVLSRLESYTSMLAAKILDIEELGPQVAIDIPYIAEPGVCFPTMLQWHDWLCAEEACKRCENA
jgi:hypothetical protein